MQISAQQQQIAQLAQAAGMVQYSSPQWYGVPFFSTPFSRTSSADTVEIPEMLSRAWSAAFSRTSSAAFSSTSSSSSSRR
jgi:hypothetical protein